MTQVEEIVEALNEAATKTSDDLIVWASSSENSGPWSEEVYRTCVHIAVNNRRLAENFAAALKDQP